MKSSRALAAAIFILLVICSSMLSYGSPEETENSEDQRKRESAGEGEVDEEAEFAAAVLGLVHNRVRDVGNVFRVVGDTAGGVAGGGIKAVGAGVHGVSSVLDAVSHTVEPKPGVLVETHDDHEEGPKSKTHTAHDGGSPDPFGRISSMARGSLSGGLNLVSAATRGVGDAVFQAGTVAEDLTGGTGQVAEDIVRVMQGAVGRARDDALKAGNHNDAEEGQTESQSGNWPSSPSEPQAPASSESTSAGGEDAETATASGVMRVWTLCREAGAFALMMLEEELQEVVRLFRGKNGAFPSAPRLAVLIILVLVICRGRRRPLRNDSSQQQLNLQSTEMAPPTTPQRSHAVVEQEPPSARAAATSPGLASSSRSLFSHTSMSSAHPPPPEVVGQLPSFGTYDGAPDGLDPLLPSPAQALGRVSHARTGRTRTASRGEPATGLVHEEIDVEGAAATTSGRFTSEEEATRGRWDWRRVFRWTGLRRPRGEGIVRWCWILLLLLWFSASVLEERERDRVAWLAWDEGFRAGEAFRVGDPDAPAESVAWLNSLIDGMWGGQRSGLQLRKSDVGVALDTAASPGVLDGLGSFISEHMATSVTEALDEFNSKPGRAVRMQLQEVDLGSSSPQILGVKVLDPASPAAPGWGDDRCGTLERNCLAFRFDLEVATQGLRVGVGVKPSARGEKALLPTGKVRLLELYFKGSLSVRVERRDEFPFVGMALVAFDGVPDVQVRVEQRGLDTLTLGRLDKWTRLGVQAALKPYVLPLYLEVDAALALCSDCPASTPANASLRQEALDGVGGAAPNTLSVPSSSRPSVAAATAEAAPAAAASAAPDKPLVSRARSRRKSSSDEPLVGDTAADELRQQARIASDRDPKESGGFLVHDSSSGENDSSEDRTDERQAAAEVDQKLHKWRRGINRVVRRFKDPKRSGGSLGRDSSSGENDRSENRTDERQAPVSMASEASSADSKRSGGSLGRDSSSGENDLSEDRTDERQAPVSMASAGADDPKIHARGWGIGRVLGRFKDWLMSGLDAEEDAQVDGAWRLSPMDLDGFE